MNMEGINRGPRKTQIPETVLKNRSVNPVKESSEPRTKRAPETPPEYNSKSAPPYPEKVHPDREGLRNLVHSAMKDAPKSVGKRVSGAVGAFVTEKFTAPRLEKKEQKVAQKVSIIDQRIGAVDEEIAALRSSDKNRSEGLAQLRSISPEHADTKESRSKEKALSAADAAKIETLEAQKKSLMAERSAVESKRNVLSQEYKEKAQGLLDRFSEKLSPFDEKIKNYEEEVSKLDETIHTYQARMDELTGKVEKVSTLISSNSDKTIRSEGFAVLKTMQKELTLSANLIKSASEMRARHTKKSEQIAQRSSKLRTKKEKWEFAFQEGLAKERGEDQIQSPPSQVELPNSSELSEQPPLELTEKAPPNTQNKPATASEASSPARPEATSNESIYSQIQEITERVGDTRVEVSEYLDVWSTLVDKQLITRPLPSVAVLEGELPQNETPRVSDIEKAIQKTHEDTSSLGKRELETYFILMRTQFFTK